MKRILKVLVVVIFCNLFMVGCNKEEPIEKEETFLNLGVMERIEDIPIIIAKEKGFFKEVGMNVKLKRFKKIDSLIEGIKNKEIIEASIGIDYLLTENDKGANLIITSNSNEHLKIVGIKGINNIKEFDEKQISIKDNNISKYIVQYIKNNENINLIPKIIKQRPVELEALRSCKVSGALLNEIEAYILEPAGINIISDIKDDYGIESDVIAFDSKIIKDNPNNIKKFYSGYNKAIDYLNRVDINDYIEIIEGYGISKEIIGYLKSNYKRFDYPKEITKEQFNNLMLWIKENKVISKEYKYKDITYFKGL